MIPVLQHDRAFLFNGDAGNLGDVLEPNSIDAIVTDPPAGIGFMGKEWDSNKGGRDAWIKWLAETLAPAFAALKPGGHALVWAIPRTSHWTAYALELAGFEIRDRVQHLFGTGFPKSLNVGEGRGTALKPACEDWWLVRKPLEGTVAANVQKWGTGALNIDGCRIATTDDLNGGAYSKNTTEVTGAGFTMPRGKAGEFKQPEGRWPAHLVLDEEAAAILDEQSGPAGAASPASGPRVGVSSGRVYKDRAGMGDRKVAFHADSGGASRFFYVAKPTTRERDHGCEALPAKTGGEATGREDGSAGVANPRAGAGRGGGRRNFHPTVKSIALMRWLCRLITPPGGTVLDPFCGSGSTGVAALAEGFSFVGVERDPDYVPIATARIVRAIAEAEAGGKAA